MTNRINRWIEIKDQGETILRIHISGREPIVLAALEKIESEVFYFSSVGDLIRKRVKPTLKEGGENK